MDFRPAQHAELRIFFSSDTGPQSGQEIPVGQVSGGVLARMRPELSVGAPPCPLPGGNLGVAAAREVGTHASPGRQCRDGS